MKTKLIAVIAALAVASAQALSFEDIIKFGTAADQAKALSLVASPTYAPGLVDKNGDTAEWGATVAALYPVFDAGIVQGAAGLRFSWLANELFLPQVNVQLGVPFLFLNRVQVTSFAHGGAVFPLGAWASDGPAVGAVYGAGLGVDVFTWERNKTQGIIAIGFGWERWENSGWANPRQDVYGLGAALTLKFL